MPTSQSTRLSPASSWVSVAYLLRTDTVVNRPDTFVSSSPYYVVNNIKQIKPFLLIVQGNGTSVVEPPPVVNVRKALFKHDPSLMMQPAFFGQPLQVVSCQLPTPRLTSRRCPTKSINSNSSISSPTTLKTPALHPGSRGSIHHLKADSIGYS